MTSRVPIIKMKITIIWANHNKGCKLEHSFRTKRNRQFRCMFYWGNPRNLYETYLACVGNHNFEGMHSAYPLKLEQTYENDRITNSILAK